MDNPDYQLITNPEQWTKCLDLLRAEPKLAVDLEANSMFAYRERVCLIQVSTPQQDFIVDPLAPLNLDELGEIFADPSIEKIFHAAEYDLILMKRQYDWEVNNLFDTMWAARILGYKRYGLASLLKDIFDVRLNKRYQKSNWCRRPLSSEQLAYACYDTHFLFDLRNRLAAQLAAERHLEEADEIFNEHSRVKINDNGFDPDSFWSINGAHELSRQEQAVLKAINIFRDQEARERNQPLFKIFSDRTLFEIAQSCPVTTDQLASVHGMSRGQIRRYGHKILEVVKRARHDTPPKAPKRPKRAPDVVLLRYERLHTWRKQRARERGVESDVIISRDALWDMAHANPRSCEELVQLDTVGEWRSKTYGPEILQVLEECSPS
ncbi:MAG: ribonuclease D [Candidatus Promineifilaceae bacterium]|jgi:ribonuclease D